MKLIGFLFAAFVITVIVTKLLTGNFNVQLAGLVGMSVLLGIAALGRLAYAKGLSMMIPDFIPFKLIVVYISGLIEVAAAIGLLIPYSKTLTGWLLIAFFILILPANIKAAMQRINFQTGEYDGSGPSYLWFRIPMQLFLIGWTYLFAIWW